MEGVGFSLPFHKISDCFNKQNNFRDYQCSCYATLKDSAFTYFQMRVTTSVKQLDFPPMLYLSSLCKEHHPFRLGLAFALFSLSDLTQERRKVKRSRETRACLYQWNARGSWLSALNTNWLQNSAHALRYSLNVTSWKVCFLSNWSFSSSKLIKYVV